MEGLQHLIPVHKFDIERAEAAVDAGYPAVSPILDELVAWLQDANWPVARVLVPFLKSIGAPLVPHVRRVLATDDVVWKYFVIETLIPSIPIDAATELRAELERLAHAPSPNEFAEGLNEVARDALVSFGWA